MRLKIESNTMNERGDTIIEVIFAIVIFSFVAISSLAIMNQGIAIGQRALETSLVRMQVNAQAEALRFIHEATVVSPQSAKAEIWRRLVNDFQQASASPYGMAGDKCVLPAGVGFRPFIMNARTAQIWSSVPTVEPASASLPPYAQVMYDDNSNITAAYGIWVESVPSSSLVVKPFVDFHIRACWAAPGSSQPMTIGTIVRLYDPVS